MSDPHREALEKDIAFLAQMMQLEGTGFRSEQEIRKLRVMAERYPRIGRTTGGMHEGAGSRGDVVESGDGPDNP